MPTGVLIAPDRAAVSLVDDVLDKARAAHDAGVSQLWLGQQLDYDAISLAAVIGTAIPTVAVGTSVVPINPRHPLIVAAGRKRPRRRRTASSASGWVSECRTLKSRSSASRQAIPC